MRRDIDCPRDQDSATSLIAGCVTHGEYVHRRTLRIRAMRRDLLLTRKLFDRALRRCVGCGLVLECRDVDGRFLYSLRGGGAA